MCDQYFCSNMKQLLLAPCQWVHNKSVDYVFKNLSPCLIDNLCKDYQFQTGSPFNLYKHLGFSEKCLLKSCKRSQLQGKWLNASLLR